MIRWLCFLYCQHSSAGYPAEEWGGLFHNEALVRDAVVGVGAHDIGAFRQAFFRIVGFLKLIQIMTQSR